jgi:hypothetical protein
MTARSPTPDMLSRFHKGSRLDHCGDKSAHSMEKIIHENAQGPHCHLDAATNAQRMGENLGAGSESVKAAGDSIPSGARAPKVDFSHLSRIRSVQKY